jgi:hypothetical protein
MSGGLASCSSYGSGYWVTRGDSRKLGNPAGSPVTRAESIAVAGRHVHQKLIFRLFRVFSQKEEGQQMPLVGVCGARRQFQVRSLERPSPITSQTGAGFLQASETADCADNAD